MDRIGEMLLTHFDRIYIVNLPSRTDRRREMVEQLGKVGLTLSDARIRLFPAVRPNEKGDWPSIGARGCFMSHLSILQGARDEGLSSLAIFEDDMNFSRSFLVNPDIYLNILRDEPWDFFHGGDPARVASVACPMPVRPTSDQGMVTTHCIGLRGDVITRAAAYLERIIARPAGDPAGGPMHVDGAYTWFRKDNPDVIALTVLPNMAYQRASATDISPKTKIEQIPGIRSLLSLSRRLKNWLHEYSQQ